MVGGLASGNTSRGVLELVPMLFSVSTFRWGLDPRVFALYRKSQFVCSASKLGFDDVDVRNLS